VRAIDLTRRRKLRGYDAVHLACALFLQETLLSHDLSSPVVLSADQELSAAAQAEGLRTDDPNAYTQ
jgi:predicted nucleic acid-binding protein